MGGHERDPIEELKGEIGDLYGFISRFIELDETGEAHRPFHPPDRHPSCAVNRERNDCVGFRDMTGGDAIGFYQHLEGVGFLQAVKELAQMVGREDLIDEIEMR